MSVTATRRLDSAPSVGGGVRRRHRRRALSPVPAWWRVAVQSLTWTNLMVVLALWIMDGQVQQLTGWASGLTSLGRLTALASAALLLVQVLLMARIPAVERVYGQDELARLHRLVGFTSFTLMIVHIALITLGYAALERRNVLVEGWSLVVDYPGMMLALAGTVLLTMVAATSMRMARRRLRYESWHLVHLYAYLGVGLALPHQLWTGQEFISHPVAGLYWWSLWIAAAGAVLTWRRCSQVPGACGRAARGELAVEDVPADEAVVVLHLVRPDDLAVEMICCLKPGASRS